MVKINSVDFYWVKKNTFSQINFLTQINYYLIEYLWMFSVIQWKDSKLGGFLIGLIKIPQN